MSADKKKIIAVAATLIIAVLAAVSWYYMYMTVKPGGKAQEAVPLTGDEKKMILKDLSAPIGNTLPDASKQKILQNLSSPVRAGAPSAASPGQTAPQINDQEKLKLLESLKSSPH